VNGRTPLVAVSVNANALFMGFSGCDTSTTNEGVAVVKGEPSTVISNGRLPGTVPERGSVFASKRASVGKSEPGSRTPTTAIAVGRVLDLRRTARLNEPLPDAY